MLDRGERSAKQSITQLTTKLSIQVGNTVEIKKFDKISIIASIVKEIGICNTNDIIHLALLSDEIDVAAQSSFINKVISLRLRRSVKETQ